VVYFAAIEGVIDLRRKSVFEGWVDDKTSEVILVGYNRLVRMI
jgi:hypothetical protein